MMEITQLESAVEELNRTFSLPTYERFEVAWVAVTKIAHLLPGQSEDQRLLALLDRLPEESVRYILAQEAVDTLLNLTPPLEEVPVSGYEQLDPERTAAELNKVRLHRGDNPRLALRNLTKVLKRIRNRRVHGFKTPRGPRDTEILGAALKIIQRIGYSAAEALGAR